MNAWRRLVTGPRRRDTGPRRRDTGPAPSLARWGTLAGAVWLAVPFAVALLITAPGGLAALTEREVEERVLRISHELRCPTCQGLSIKDSEAPLSRQMRDKVRRMVAEGQSDEAVKAFFVSRYGEWILRSPKKEGLGLVVWMLPGLAMIAAGGLIGWRLHRNQQGARAAGPTAAGTLTDAQRKRIAQDRERFEAQDDSP